MYGKLHENKYNVCRSINWFTPFNLRRENFFKIDAGCAEAIAP